MDENKIREELKKYNFYHIIKLIKKLCTKSCLKNLNLVNIYIYRANFICCKQSKAEDIKFTQLHEY